MDTKIDFHQPKFEPKPSGHVIAARITSENPDEGIFQNKYLYFFSKIKITIFSRLQTFGRNSS